MTSEKQAADKALFWETHTAAEDEISKFTIERAVLDTVEKAEAAAQLLQEDNFTRSIQHLADQCDKILADLGFPGAAEMVRHDGEGNWWRQPNDAPARPSPGETWMFIKGRELAKAGKDFSDSWYAGEIGLKCRHLLEHLAKGDSGTPFVNLMIFRIASLNRDWDWRQKQKGHVIRGRKTLKAAHDGAVMRRNALASDTMARLACMQELIDKNPKMGISWAAKTLAKRSNGGSAAANRALWYRHRGKKL